MNTLARWIMFTAMLVIAGTATAAPRDEAAWTAVRTELFGERPIAEGEHLLHIEAPYRAADAALVPIEVREKQGADGAPEIHRLYLIVDNNPTPLTGIVEFGPAAASATFATRIRINAYTHVRAVAETVDGRLFMAKRYVKASGGCTAPAGVAEEEALRDLGQMRARSWPDEDGEGMRVQLGIRHPNFSGLQMDQLTRLYRPAFHVTDVRVGYGGREVLTAKLTIGVSRNPSLRFYIATDAEAGPQPLTVTARDNEGNRFEETLELSPPLAAQ
jgi:sulfur-oxidizing protein SoxY